MRSRSKCCATKTRSAMTAASAPVRSVHVAVARMTGRSDCNPDSNESAIMADPCLEPIQRPITPRHARLVASCPPLFFRLLRDGGFALQRLAQLLDFLRRQLRIFQKMKQRRRDRAIKNAGQKRAAFLANDLVAGHFRAVEKPP